MALYISDASKNLKKISGNFVNDPRKANVNLSNVTYPVITTGRTTTGSGDRVIEQYMSSDGKTWYRVWSSGWKECGGKVTLTTTEGWVQPVVTFPIQFNTSLLSLSINVKLTTYQDQAMFGQITAYSNTGFTTGVYTAPNRNEFFWYACGY